MKVIALRLETCHANTDGVAWYAYTDGVLTDTEELQELYETDNVADPALEVDGGPLGVNEWETPVEVPNALSKYAKLRRYYVASAG